MIKFVKKISLLLIGITCALIATEAYLRFTFPQITYSSLKPPYDFRCFKEGTYYWLALKPNSNCILKSNGDAFAETIIKTNSLGLRNPEITFPKPANLKRILFLGDSFTIGWGVNEIDTFPRVVENLLNQSQIELSADTRVESINAGLTGTGPGYYYTFLKHQGLALDPDIVVVNFYMFNDLPENSNYSDWVEINEDGLPEKIISKLDYVDPVSGYFFPKNTPFKYKIPILRNLHLFNFTSDKIFPEEDFDPTIEISKLRICLYKSECRDLDIAKEKTKKLFLGIKKLLDEKNKKLLVVFIPSEFQTNRNARVKYIPISLFPSEKEYPYILFKEFFDNNNITYLDLRPDFTKLGSDDSYYELDDHWNAKGHSVAAAAISDKLIQLLK